MRGPATALLWEIWWPHRWTVAAIAGVTAAGRLLHASEGPGGEPSPLVTLLAMLAFLLLFAVFNYTESDDGRELGRFPRRLFTLPVTSLRLVAVPALGGIASIELLYFLWMPPLSEGGSASVPFVAVLLAAFVVFYQSATWTLERAGSLRLVLLGAIAIALFAAGLLPSFPPSPPPLWRSEAAVAAGIAGLAGVAFVLAWLHVARLRTGGRRRADPGALWHWLVEIAPARQRAFSSPAAAQFWFEWRASGRVLPALVSGLLLVIVLPMSWVARGDADDTLRLLIAALAAPLVLAIPVGIAFSKPAFWSEDLSVPAFVAVRPLSSADLVATKVSVAAVSAALAWLIVLVFLTVWLTAWGNLDVVSLSGIRLAVLIPLTGMLLTWRFLVSRLWSGLSGIRRLFVGSALLSVILVIAGIVSDAHLLPGWLLAEPARIAWLMRLIVVAVIVKYAVAAYAWRRIAGRYRLAYLPIWVLGTASFLALAREASGFRGLVILLALLAVPLARLGLAPLLLARNRHR